MVKGSCNATEFGPSDGVGFTVACRVNCVNCILGKEGLVCRVERRTRKM